MILPLSLFFRLLAVITVIILSHGSAHANSRVGRSSTLKNFNFCLNELDDRLHFSLKAALKKSHPFAIRLRIAPENTLKRELIQDVIDVSLGNGAFQSLPENCAREKVQLAEELWKFVDERFTLLLSPNLKDRDLALDLFHTELFLFTLLAKVQPSGVSRLSLLSKTYEPLYLNALREVLFDKLKETRWEKFADIFFTMEHWSDEWLKLLPQAAPAAVDLTHSKIALRPLEQSPREMEISLFHELAHLNGWKTGKDLFINEVAAWAETLDFIEELERRKFNIPPLFQNVRDQVKSFGLETWVQLTWKTSRGNLKP